MVLDSLLGVEQKLQMQTWGGRLHNTQIIMCAGGDGRCAAAGKLLPVSCCLQNCLTPSSTDSGAQHCTDAVHMRAHMLCCGSALHWREPQGFCSVLKHQLRRLGR